MAQRPLDLNKVLPTVAVAERDLRTPTYDGLGVVRTVRGTFDVSGGVHAGTVGTYNLVDEDGDAIVVPDNAIILDGIVDVTVTFVTAGADAGTIAIQVNGADDIVAAIAVSDVSNPWDAGLHDVIPVGTAATAVKLTANRNVSVLVAGQNATAGTMTVTLRYIVGD